MCLRGLNFERKQLEAALCIYLGSIIFGYITAWPSPGIIKLQDPDQSPLPQPMTDVETSLVGSLYYLGGVFGANVCGFISHSKGRKASLIIGGCVTILAFITTAIAFTPSLIYLGRVLGGFGTCIMFVTNFVYIGEIASTKVRGLLLTATGVFSTFGTVLVYSVGPYVSYSMSSYIAAGISVVYVVLVYVCVPETPIFQVLRGRHDKVRDSLRKLGRYSDLEKIFQATIETEDSKKDWRQIFTVKSNRKALIITLALHILQHLGGYGPILVFCTSIFKMANSSIEPHIATIIVGLTQCSASIIAPLIVERSGKKLLLAISCFGCTICLSLLAGYFLLEEMQNPIINDILWLPLVLVFAYLIFFNTGFSIIPSALIGEVFSLNVRSIGSSLAFTISWMVGFIVVSAFGYINSMIGVHVSFWMYSSACFCAFLITIFFVPETKGKTLYEIQEILGD